MKDPTKAAPGSTNNDIKMSNSAPPLGREKTGDYSLLLGDCILIKILLDVIALNLNH